MKYSLILVLLTNSDKNKILIDWKNCNCLDYIDYYTVSNVCGSSFQKQHRHLRLSPIFVYIHSIVDFLQNNQYKSIVDHSSK